MMNRKRTHVRLAARAREDAALGAVDAGSYFLAAAIHDLGATVAEAAARLAGDADDTTTELATKLYRATWDVVTAAREHEGGVGDWPAVRAKIAALEALAEEWEVER